MNFLIAVFICDLVMILDIDGVRSASLSEPAEKFSESEENVIILEVVPSADEGTSKVDETGNRIEGDAKHKTTSESSDPYRIVVPIARKFSSLKELFEILKENDQKHPIITDSTKLAYVQGIEGNGSDYRIFLT